MARVCPGGRTSEVLDFTSSIGGGRAKPSSNRDWSVPSVALRRRNHAKGSGGEGCADEKAGLSSVFRALMM